MKKNNPSVDYEIYEKRRKEHAKNADYRRAYAEEEQMFMLAEEIRKYRSKKHYTQKQLADKVGMKQQEISRIEKGDQNSKIETLSKIAHGVGKRLILKLG